MAFCGNCGTKVEDGKKFCPQCGTPVEAANPTQAKPNPQPQPNPQWQAPKQAQNLGAVKGGADFTSQFDKADIEANKMMALLSYLIFFIPLIAAKESKYAMFHANQGLTLFLAGVIVSIAGSVIPFLGWFLILPVGCIIVAVLGIMGIINAWKGLAKELPIIGKFKLIK